MTRWNVTRERSSYLHEMGRAPVLSREAVGQLLRAFADWWNTSVPKSRDQLVAGMRGEPLDPAGEAELLAVDPDALHLVH